MTRRAGALLAAAVFAPAAVWFALQQFAGSLVYFACAAGGPPLGPALALASLGACAVAGWGCWRARRSDPSPTRRFAARAGLGAAAIFALAVALTAAAAWLVPPCAR